MQRVLKDWTTGLTRTKLNKTNWTKVKFWDNGDNYVSVISKSLTNKICRFYNDDESNVKYYRHRFDDTPKFYLLIYMSPMD